MKNVIKSYIYPITFPDFFTERKNPPYFTNQQIRYKIKAI